MVLPLCVGWCRAKMFFFYWSVVLRGRYAARRLNMFSQGPWLVLFLLFDLPPLFPFPCFFYSLQVGLSLDWKTVTLLTPHGLPGLALLWILVPAQVSFDWEVLVIIIMSVMGGYLWVLLHYIVYSYHHDT